MLKLTLEELYLSEIIFIFTYIYTHNVFISKHLQLLQKENRTTKSIQSQSSLNDLTL